MERLSDALQNPQESNEAAAAIRGLIERITLTPGPKRGQIDATLHGDLGTILEWTASKHRKNKTDTPGAGVSVSVVAGARGQRYQQELFQAAAGRSNPIQEAIS